jgi:hypothetical protein
MKKSRVIIGVAAAVLLLFGTGVSYASGSSYASEGVSGVKTSYVTIDMSGGTISPVLMNARNQMNAADSLENMAKNVQAFAAINGTYFSSYSGIPVSWGTMIRDGKVLHISQSGAVCGITSDGRLMVDRLTFDFEGYINGQYRAIPWRINHPSPEQDAITIYTPEYGTVVDVVSGAKAAVIQDGSVIQIAESDFYVPVGGFAILYNPTVAYLVDERYRVGDEVEYKVKIHTNFTDAADWNDVKVGIGAGPSLIINGLVTALGEAEGFTEAKVNTQASGRSFIGAKADGTIIIGTMTSATLVQAAEACRSLGLVNAMCLDGGDSSALYYPAAGISTHGRNLNNGLAFVDASEVYTTAKPNEAAVLLDGKTSGFTAYNINGSNYFKLRDLAMALSGSKKEFNVIWDGGLNAIRIQPDETYVPVGGEMSLPTGAETEKAYPSTATIYLRSSELTLNAYSINGSNYFKLRDAGRSLDFGVSWDAEKNTISIDTNSSYEE